eukprot:SM000027S09725  [mRNA]  locus=s27:939866:945351:- [translate_table: standard]
MADPPGPPPPLARGPPSPLRAFSASLHRGPPDSAQAASPGELLHLPPAQALYCMPQSSGVTLDLLPLFLIQLESRTASSRSWPRPARVADSPAAPCIHCLAMLSPGSTVEAGSGGTDTGVKDSCTSPGVSSLDFVADQPLARPISKLHAWEDFDSSISSFLTILSHAAYLCKELQSFVYHFKKVQDHKMLESRRQPPDQEQCQLDGGSETGLDRDSEDESKVLSRPCELVNQAFASAVEYLMQTYMWELNMTFEAVEREQSAQPAQDSADTAYADARQHTRAMLQDVVSDPVHSSLLHVLFWRACDPYFEYLRSSIHHAPVGDSKVGLMEAQDLQLPCFLQELEGPLLRTAQQLQVLFGCLGGLQLSHADKLAGPHSGHANNVCGQTDVPELAAGTVEDQTGEIREEAEPSRQDCVEDLSEGALGKASQTTLSTSSRTYDPSTETRQSMHMQGVLWADPLLHSSLSATPLFQGCHLRSKPMDNDSDEPTGSSHTPLDVALEKGIIREILSRYHVISQRCVALFLEDLSLSRHLMTLRRFFFLGAGDWADHFSASVCRLSWEGKATCARVADALGESLTSTSGRWDPLNQWLQVRVDEKQQDDGVSFVQLHYNVEWPLSLVLHGTALMQYQEIFSVLLNLKAACHSLHHVWEYFRQSPELSDLSPKSPQHPMRQPILHLLRHMLAHVVRTVLHWMQRQLLEKEWRNLNEYLSGTIVDICECIDRHNRHQSCNPRTQQYQFSKQAAPANCPTERAFQSTELLAFGP